MIYLLMTVVCNTGAIFFIGWHGLAGAIAWGINIILFDLFWQWLRCRQVGHANSARIITGVVFGYVVRLASVLIMLKIGQIWLTPQVFWICAAFTLAIPLTSILGVYMLMQRGFK